MSETKVAGLSQKLLLGLFLLVIFLFSFNQIANPDTFYDLKTGQYILVSRQIPTHDIFSLPAAGALWVPHEWLAQVIFYLIYSRFGFFGLIVFAALLSVLTYFLLFRLVLKKGADFYLSLLSLFLLSYLTLELWVPRPQIFAYFAFALLLCFLEEYRSSLNDKFLIAAALTLWFWANVNASFVLGLVVISFYFLAEWVKDRWPGRFGQFIPFTDVRDIGFASLIAIGLCFLTPASYRGFLYSFYVQPVVSYLSVLEWKPITSFFYEIQDKILLAILFLVDIFLIWRLWFRKESRDITWLGLILGVSLLPFISIRHIGFWPLAIFLPLAVSLGTALKNFPERLSKRDISAALVFLGMLLIASRLFWMPKSLTNEVLIPVAAADFIQENNLHGPLFNLYNEGDYLIWRLWPKDKVFLDGRSEVYRGQPLLDFFTILDRQPGWPNLVDKKYKLNYFFLANYYAPGIEKEVEPLTNTLLQKGFVLVYWNDDAVILVRPTQENADIIKRYGLKYINPFFDPSRIPPSNAKAAAQEIQALLERYPNSQEARDYARRFLLSH